MAIAAGAPGAGAEERPAVLLLDDEADARELLALVLEGGGFRVSAAEDGPAGLRLLRAGWFDAALVDLLMPGMDGRRFLAEVGRLDPERRPKVLIVSALDRASVERELGGLPCHGILPKPFAFDVLRREVALAVAARRAERGPEAGLRGGVYTPGP